jgi:hypothetical protein
LKGEVDSKCQLCKQCEETIGHLTSGCPILAKNEYLIRHDKVAVHLYDSICKALGIETTDKLYTHTSKPVCEHEDVTVLWNQGVHTGREVIANKPDIIHKNKKEKTCVLIDVAIQVDRNFTRKEAEQKLKYKSLCMWKMKCMIIPMVIGATGIVTKGLRKNLEALAGKHSIDALQKTAVLGTSHIIRKVLLSETWYLSSGDHRWFKRSTREQWPMTGQHNNNNRMQGVAWINLFQDGDQWWTVVHVVCKESLDSVKCI